MHALKTHLGRVAVSFILLSMLAGCSSLPSFQLFGSDVEDQARLSEKNRERREALLEGKSARPSLQSLDLQPVRMEEIAVPELTLAQKRDQYQALLPLIKDPVQKQQVAFRLADIKMMIAEQAQREGPSPTISKPSLADPSATLGVYADAISAYKKVLNEHEVITPALGTALTPEQQALNRKQMDAMYQLARALDLSAQSEASLQVAKAFLDTFDTEVFDVTPYHIELFFRIGEYYFNRQQYEQAAIYYQQVVEQDQTSLQNQTNFYAISAYMLGWSQFKLDDYLQAMQAFATMLDTSLRGVSNLRDTPLAALPLRKGELRLVKDSIRMMALTFSYQGNAEAIKDFFKVYGKRDFEPLIYDELAQQHLDNDRYQDSADVLVAFANAYPSHERAVEFYIRHIDAFVLGDFPASVLLAKENFVQTYSLGMGVVQNLNTPIGRDATPYLRDYIKQLAQTEHSIAQGIDAILASRLVPQQSVNKVQGTLVPSSDTDSGFVAQAATRDQRQAWQLASDADLADLSRQAYAKAKQYYENFIRTFSPDPEVPELRFYLAEAHFALGEYKAAIDAFETYAFVDSPNPRAVEAAYAALLAYEELPPLTAAEAQMANVSTQKFNAPLSTKQISQGRFVTVFGQDPRASTVALTLMQDLFNSENYLQAQEWANWLLENAKLSSVSDQMQESAQLVMAHSYFAMAEFALAEAEYRVLLRQLSPADTRVAELRDRLAASLYKQAESLLVGAALDTASLQSQNINRKSQLTPLQLSTLEQGVALLQQVVMDTPSSEFRLAAQYDSAVYYGLLEQWPQAISTFLDFQQRYPQHPLAAGIDEQLFYAYQETQNWPQAAAILKAKYRAQPDTEQGRLALFQAAEYYEKAGDRGRALDNFRRYAHQYPQPMADANEARFTLSEYYKQSKEDTKRRYWLNKLVQAQLDADSEATPRSIYLASMAGMVFANDADDAFNRIKLTQPLAKSLQQKQSALNKAIDAYKQVMAFGSAEHVTAANYRLANLYRSLANDLMESDRPEGLSALELGQYEILLEEQAYPFEETSIDLHESNLERMSQGLYDEWIKQSFIALESMMPARYNKPEKFSEVSVDDF